jgi:hypothetical protein
MRKICPKCNVAHEKSGIYCSYKCSNSRQWTDADKEKKRISALKSKKVENANKRCGRLSSYKAAATKLGISLDEWYELRTQGKLASQNTVKYNGCKNCGKSRKKHKIICDECRMSYYKFYRPSCEFRFALNQYLDWFDFTLLKKNGMYKASNRGNNLSGVSRDHLFSVKDAFKKKVNPEIVRHPANCRLMLHIDNNKKGFKSVITYGELLERIERFDALAERLGAGLQNL